MSMSAALTIMGSFLLYSVVLTTKRQPSPQASPFFAKQAAGTVAAVAGFALMIASRGWGVGFTASLFIFALTLAVLSLSAPLWPRLTHCAVGLILAGLFVDVLRGA